MWNIMWTQPCKWLCEMLSYCLAGLEQQWERAVTFIFLRRVFFFCCWKCYVAADVQPLNLMHRDVVSAGRELWTISAWSADFRESVGKHDIFIYMLHSLHNAERWGISFNDLWTKTHLGLWLANTSSVDEAQVRVSIHPSTPSFIAGSGHAAVVKLDWLAYYYYYYYISCDVVVYMHVCPDSFYNKSMHEQSWWGMKFLSGISGIQPWREQCIVTLTLGHKKI